MLFLLYAVTAKAQLYEAEYLYKIQDFGTNINIIPGKLSPDGKHFLSSFTVIYDTTIAGTEIVVPPAKGRLPGAYANMLGWLKQDLTGKAVRCRYAMYNDKQYCDNRGGLFDKEGYYHNFIGSQPNPLGDNSFYGVDDVLGSCYYFKLDEDLKAVQHRQMADVTVKDKNSTPRYHVIPRHYTVDDDGSVAVHTKVTYHNDFIIDPNHDTIYLDTTYYFSHFLSHYQAEKDTLYSNFTYALDDSPMGSERRSDDLLIHKDYLWYTGQTEFSPSFTLHANKGPTYTNTIGTHFELQFLRGKLNKHIYLRDPAEAHLALDRAKQYLISVNAIGADVYDAYSMQHLWRDSLYNTSSTYIMRLLSVPYFSQGNLLHQFINLHVTRGDFKYFGYQAPNLDSQKILLITQDMLKGGELSADVVTQGYGTGIYKILDEDEEGNLYLEVNSAAGTRGEPVSYGNSYTPLPKGEKHLIRMNRVVPKVQLPQVASLCNLRVALNLLPIGLADTLAVDWGDGTSPTAYNYTFQQVHKYQQAGLYQLKVVYGSRNDLQYDTLEVLAMDSGRGSIFHNEVTQVVGKSYTLTLPKDTFNTYTWADGGSGSRTFSKSGNWVLFVQSKLGCTLTDTFKLDLDTITGIDPFPQGAPFSLALSPNPTRTRVRVTLELGTNEQAQLKLLNMQGQSLQLHQLRGSGKLTEELDVSGLSPGNYIISVQAGEKRQDALLLVQ